LASKNVTVSPLALTVAVRRRLAKFVIGSGGDTPTAPRLSSFQQYMSVDPVNWNWFQGAVVGQVALYLMSQY
jgi:hypothetical protein